MGSERPDRASNPQCTMGIMEKYVEVLGVYGDTGKRTWIFWCYIGIMEKNMNYLGVYRDNIKNGNYYIIEGIY